MFVSEAHDSAENNMFKYFSKKKNKNLGYCIIMDRKMKAGSLNIILGISSSEMSNEIQRNKL